MSSELNTTGKGDWSYDKHNDILTFKVKDKSYFKSLEYESLVIDLDKKGDISGIRIFNALQLLGEGNGN